MDKNNTILIASDHNGNKERDYLIDILKYNGYNVVDFGPRTDELRWSSIKVDYVDFAEQVGYAVSRSNNRGILICGTGLGMAISANKFYGVKASRCVDVEDAQKTREHNDSNILVLGAWKNTKKELKEITLTWLSEDYGKGRHEKRVARLEKFNRDKIALVPGIFELIHGGHLELFKFASLYGKVIVSLASDKIGEQIKKRKLKVDYKKRKFVLNNIVSVDEVVEQHNLTPENLLKELKPDFYVKGVIPEYGQVLYPKNEKIIREKDNVPKNVEIKMIGHNTNYLGMFKSLKSQ